MIYGFMLQSQIIEDHLMFKEIPVNNYSIAKRKPILGVGINDANYMTIYKYENESHRCPFYMRWRSMLRRCYSEKLHVLRPTYVECCVCSEWLTFSNFKLWMKSQDWKGNHLDKDLMIYGNKTYSPKTCLFVSSNVNAILHENKKTRGKYPLGVSFHKATRKYSVNISFNGVSEYLGVFKKQHEAELAYLFRKVEIVNSLAYEQSNKDIESALLKKIEEYKLKIKGLKNA